MKTLRCPICGFESNSFQDYEGEYFILGELKDHFTKNAICPNCKSDMRHRFVYKFLTTHTDFCTSPLKLIHFAPEEWLAKKIADLENINYTPVDINPSYFNYLDVQQADINALPFDDETFDALIMIHVLEHIPDDAKAIKEMYRVLKKNGWAVIAVPTIGEKTHSDPGLSSEEREKMYGINQHYRLYGTDLAEKLESVGFCAKIYEFTDIGCDFADLKQSSPHIDSDKYIFYCKKRTPKLSIITVTYNAAEVLEKTLQSIFKQEFHDYEIIIIDGSSTDNTLNIINQYSTRITHWVSESDNGIYDAMNKGLAAACGEYVQFLNAGDYFSDDQVLTDIFSDTDSRPTLIYGDIYILALDGGKSYLKAGNFTLDELLKRGTGVICHQAMFVRRECAPLYDCKYKYKAELNWYFDIVESENTTSKHVERPIVCYSLGGVGYNNFIRNRVEWVLLIYHRYGIATLFESRIIIFLLSNSLHRYPILKSAVNYIKRAGSFFRQS